LVGCTTTYYILRKFLPRFSPDLTVGLSLFFRSLAPGTIRLLLLSSAQPNSLEGFSSIRPRPRSSRSGRCRRRIRKGPVQGVTNSQRKTISALVKVGGNKTSKSTNPGGNTAEVLTKHAALVMSMVGGSQCHCSVC
jgi:hypothetical protein